MTILLLLGIIWAVAAVLLLPVWLKRKPLGWQITAYLATTVLLLALGSSFLFSSIWPGVYSEVTIPFATGAYLMCLTFIWILFGVIEFAVLPGLGAFRLGAIARVTYYEALLQPFTIIVLAAGVIAISLSARLPFYTYDEDFKMYRDVAASFVFLFTVPIMIFASTKVIDEEIENRTMLTLMSKPVARWQVVVGKYLGVLLLLLVAVVALGIIAGICGYMRYYDDKLVDYRSGPTTEQLHLLNLNNFKAFMVMFPSLILTFLQVATLAAISVAVSTRYGLAANITTVVVIYVAANLARYVTSTGDLPPVVAGAMTIVTYLLPGLSLLDLNQRLVFGNYIWGTDDWARGLPEYATIWRYVGVSTIYALFYIAAALSFGVALFRSRELS